MLEMNFNKLGGVIPVVAQDYQTGEVLMVAFMNREAWEHTLRTGYVHYWSRSRGKLWKKGETSGNLQEVQEIRVDCDCDCLLVRVRQIGEAACHTGFRSCFYRVVQGDDLLIDGERIFDPEKVYGDKE